MGFANVSELEELMPQAKCSSMKVCLLFIAVPLLCGTTIFGQSNSPSLTFVIPEGMRAIAIGGGAVINAVASVNARDRVDILATYQRQSDGQVVTKLIMQNVLVLAVTKGNADPSHKDAGESAMTLAVKPEDVDLVAAADRAGALSVMLRPAHSENTSVSSPPGEKTIGPWRPGVGDFWRPGEFQRPLEEKQQPQPQRSE